MKSINEKLNEMRENYNSCIRSSEKIEGLLVECMEAHVEILSNQDKVNHDLGYIAKNINDMSENISENFFRMNKLFSLNQKYS